MNTLIGLLIIAGMLYGLLIDAMFWKIYFALVLAYYVVTWLFIRDRYDHNLRKNILNASWGQPQDPTSYLVLDFDLTKAMEYVKELNKDLNESNMNQKVTINTIFSLGIAWGTYFTKRDIGRLPWGTFKAAKDLNLTCLVDRDGGKALVPVTLQNAHQYDLKGLAEKLNGKQKQAKAGKDKSYEGSVEMFNFIPSFIMEPVTFIISYLIAIGYKIPGIPMREKDLGHVMITNIGTLGMNQGFAPLCPQMHAQFVYCIGKIEKRAIVDENDKIIPKHMCTVVLTCDHRYGDAALCKQSIKVIKDFVENPKEFDKSKYPEPMSYRQLHDKKKQEKKTQ